MTGPYSGRHGSRRADHRWCPRDGRDIALKLAARGWSIAIGYRDSAEAAAQTVAAIEARGSAALALRADVGDPDACRDLVAGAGSWRGRIDALVHAAGPYHRVELLDETPEGGARSSRATSIRCSTCRAWSRPG